MIAKTHALARVMKPSVGTATSARRSDQIDLADPWMVVIDGSDRQSVLWLRTVSTFALKLK